MEIVSINRVKARKPHKCDMCGKKIEVGEEYEAQNLVCYNEIIRFINATGASRMSMSCGA